MSVLTTHKNLHDCPSCHCRPSPSSWVLVEKCRHCGQAHDDALGACWGALHDAWGHFPLGCREMGHAEPTDVSHGSVASASERLEDK